MWLLCMQKAGKQECELMDVKRECDGNTVRLYLLSKLECVFPYALKVIRLWYALKFKMVKPPVFRSLIF